jgi:hypothetical protein
MRPDQTQSELGRTSEQMSEQWNAVTPYSAIFYPQALSIQDFVETMPDTAPVTTTESVFCLGQQKK